MSRNASDVEKYSLAKSFTELAIQNRFFVFSKDSNESAKQVASFFNTIVEKLDLDLERS